MHPSNVPSGASSRSRGRGFSRGRGKPGRESGGQRGGMRNNAAQVAPSSSVAESGHERPLTSLKDVRAGEKTAEAADNAEGDEEADGQTCFICANATKYIAIAPCNHRSCHVCALRMRALYKNKDCPHCRTPAPYVIFTENLEANYTDYEVKDVAFTDENIGIKYASANISGDSVILLKYNCPDESCDFQALGWPDLHRHVKSFHHKRLCDLCSRNKKVFTHEHALFSEDELRIHMTRGDDQPGAVDQTGFKGHPRCEFCRERYYDSDKLYEHCRNKHERCFICDRNNPAKPHYFRDYGELEVHFRNDHFLCLDRECLEKKFVVFDSQLDLKAHQLHEHGNSLSKDVRRDARIVDMSNFDYRAAYEPVRRGGRGRNPAVDEPLPQSSAQPLRRDELAVQRQMAIQSAQSQASRTTGGSGSGTSAAASRQPGRPAAPPTSSQAAALPTAAAQTPQDMARSVRHGAVVERASNLLGHDAAKINLFRSHVSAYKQGSMVADQLLDAFFALFSDTSSNAIGTLIKEVAELYENEDKKRQLLTAWQDWRAINEDYPSLPAAAGTTSAGGYAAAAASIPSLSAPGNTGSNVRTKEVLRLKSATRKNKATANNNLATIVGTRPALPMLALPRPPPAIPAAAFPALQENPNEKVRTIWNFDSLTGNLSDVNGGWASSGSSGSGKRAPASRVAIHNKEAFPSLPAAPKPQTKVWGLNNAVRSDFGQKKNTGFAWGESGSGPDSSSGPGNAPEEPSNTGGGGKGKKKGKQVLMQWG